MVDKAHLPSAVERTDLDQLDRIERCVVLELADECGEWLKSCDEYRRSLITPAALTLWSALVKSEFEQITEIYERLKAEIFARDEGGSSDEKG